MSENISNLLISVGAVADVDKEGLDELSYELIADLHELDCVGSIKPVKADELPEGAKGFPIEVGTILVELVEAGGIPFLITALSSWLSRDKDRTLKLQLGGNSLEVTGLSKIEQQELIRWFQTQIGLRMNH